ncbi:phytanoyl-CoA dioxygenase family protein [Kiloniella sp.]|uniref:phytanoyl-CoA dioxygenase family protein n=1 Tax=Kiloniella sp. TaxID=1938587 RepID=UPI003A8D6227
MSYAKDKLNSSLEITEAVKKHGFCIIPNFIASKKLNKLNKEFDTIIKRNYSTGFYEHGCREYMDVIAVSEDNLKQSPFTAQIDLMSTPLIQKITLNFFGVDDFFIQHIFNVKSTETPAHSNELPYSLHFDKIHMLKFFFFLSDIDEDCGPTWVVPQQQHKSLIKRKEWREKGNPVQEINNIIHYHKDEVIPLTGAAGSLAILDTDTPHKAGSLGQDKVRKIIRVSASSPSYSSKG